MVVVEVVVVVMVLVVLVVVVVLVLVVVVEDEDEDEEDDKEGIDGLALELAILEQRKAFLYGEGGAVEYGARVCASVAVFSMVEGQG